VLVLGRVDHRTGVREPQLAVREEATAHRITTLLPALRASLHAARNRPGSRICSM
jgi:hypothetical protein